VIRDLAKDTRPALGEVLKESIHDVIKIDMNKLNDNRTEYEI